MQKIQKYHHSVTENGNLQLRIKNQYLNNEGKILSNTFATHKVPVKGKNGNILEYIDAISVYTSTDVNDMSGWDDRSKDIVATIIDEKVVADFDAEFWTVNGEPNTLETLVEIITFDRVIEEDGKIAVRRITRIYDEGIEVSKKYHRSWIMPGDNSLASDIMSKAIAEKLHTLEIINAYKNKMAKEAFKVK